MKVFLSWSDDQSRQLAQELKSWLAEVIQALDPWVSTSIDKGARGLEEIASALEECRVGILCLTRHNLAEPWILFEAGALSKTRDRVWTFLLDLTPADIEPPLAMFQHTESTRDEVRALLGSINREVEKNQERALTEKQLDSVFSTYWPKLDEALARIRQIAATAPEPVRTDRQLLEELLQLIRSQSEAISRLTATATLPALRAATDAPALEAAQPIRPRRYFRLTGDEDTVRAALQALRAVGAQVQVWDEDKDGIVVTIAGWPMSTEELVTVFNRIQGISVQALHPREFHERYGLRQSRSQRTSE